MTNIAPLRPDVPDNDLDEEARPPAFTDEALALHFAEARAEDLRYVAAWSKWLMWDGQRWKFDDTLHAFDLARRICREAAIECNTKAAKMIASARTVAAVERLAKADRRLAASVEQWDTDPWQLNTPAGIVRSTIGTAPAARSDRICDEDHRRRRRRVSVRPGSPSFIA